MTKPLYTFVIGGSCRVRNGKFLVQKRSWEMLRIFTDHIAYPIFGMIEEPWDETLEYELPDAVEVVGLPSSRGAYKIYKTLLNRGLSNEIRDVIDHCYAVYLRLPLWECWDIFNYVLPRGKKIFASYHGDWVDFYRKRDSNLIKHFIWMGFSIYIDHILQTIARDCEVLFCVGQSIADQYGRFAKKAFTYANFLHTENDVVKEVRSLCVKPPYKLLYVGELEERKGVEYLIKAIALLRKSGIDTELTIVGAGSLDKKLRDIAESEGLSRYIKFYGYIQHGKKLMDIYRFSDIFVLPSISSEGTPKVLMEAMSQGIPVIATNVGSSKHLLANGKYGILAEPKNVESLKTAIERLIKNSDSRNNLVSEGLKLALSSTSDSQKMIVKNGLNKAVPEIMGKPAYLT